GPLDRAAPDRGGRDPVGLGLGDPRRHPGGVRVQGQRQVALAGEEVGHQPEVVAGELLEEQDRQPLVRLQPLLDGRDLPPRADRLRDAEQELRRPLLHRLQELPQVLRHADLSRSRSSAPASQSPASGSATSRPVALERSPAARPSWTSRPTSGAHSPSTGRPSRSRLRKYVGPSRSSAGRAGGSIDSLRSAVTSWTLPGPAARPARVGRGWCTSRVPASPYATIASAGSPPTCVQLASRSPSARGYRRTTTALSSAASPSLRRCAATA